MSERQAVIDRLFPVVVMPDRYHGLYSGGEWMAISMATVPAQPGEMEPTRAAFCLEEGPNGDDEEAVRFWKGRPYWIGTGKTPEDAIDALVMQNA